MRALVATLTVLAVLALPAGALGFGIQPGAAGFSVAISGEGGTIPDSEAGSHPYAISTSVNLGLEADNLRDLTIEEAPGVIENPRAADRCTQIQFATPRNSPYEASRSGEDCPPLSQVGVLTVRSAAGERSFGVFNLVPPAGFPSQIGANPFGVPVVFTPRIRDAGGEYGIDLELKELSQGLDLQGMALTMWGSPWNRVHDAQRGNCLDEADPGFGWAKCAISLSAPSHAPEAYLTLPASCSGPLPFGVRAVAWQGVESASATSTTALEGCADLRFEPQVQAQVTNPRASSPSGFSFSLTPKEETIALPERRVPSQGRKVVVTLPEGVTLNPSLAAGLGSCSAVQYSAETATTPPGVGCPNNSKIGSFTVQSPLFEETIEGGVFLAEPDDPATASPGAENPFNSLVALYLIAKTPARGVLVKVAGRLTPDPATGRLTAVFDRMPQLPYSNLKLTFREGQRAPLVTPAACGTYATEVALSPWNEPARSVTAGLPLTVERGIGPGEACAAPGAPPFSPAAVGGSLNSSAGSYSSFYLHLTRTDAEQEFTSYSATLPPGLLGRIAGIPYCSDAAIALAQAKTGAEEEADPSCPAASQIGHTVSGYGVGSVLAYAPGRLYLAGPYHGSTFSVVAIDSAKVGPFDLGVVVIRSAIRVNPANAQVSIDSAGSDPIPHILDGVPLHLRDIRIYIDRPRMMVNPTSCDPMILSSTLTGSGARFGDPSDDPAVTVSNHFQVSNCAAVGFAPRLSLKLGGSAKHGAYPSLRALYRPRRGEANISRAEVTLPSSLFLAQEHIKTVCTRVQSERGTCPAGSVYGHVIAVTPLLAEPLEGPVYLRASAHKLPDLVASLRGDGIAIDVTGEIDSSHGGIRAIFEGLPDAPVSAFQLTLEGGKRGLLVNAADFCASRQLARARLLGHGGRGERLSPQVTARCEKAAHRPRHKKAAKGRGSG